MTASLRRIPNRLPDAGAYMVSGSLRGLKAGTRTIRELRVSGQAETLELLSELPDLRRLELERVRDVDLSGLRSSAVELLRCVDISGCDLDPISGASGLRELILGRMRDCHATDGFVLPASLTRVTIACDNTTVASMEELLAAIDWASSAGTLRELYLSGTGVPPKVDLGFLSSLSCLESLRVWTVLHDGARPSPVDPPFDGLPRSLRHVQVDAWDRAVARPALRSMFPDASVSVSERLPLPDGEGEDDWEISPPGPDVSDWGVYGSLADLPAFRHLELEYDAVQAALAMIRDADPGLAERLDFDQESDGTGMTAPKREDLEAALRIIGVTE